MKLDRNSRVYINCPTQEERDMIIDILYSLDCHWPEHSGLDALEFYNAPMYIELNKLQVRHGKGTAKNHRYLPHNYPIIEARDFRNQWIALKKRIDK